MESGINDTFKIYFLEEEVKNILADDLKEVPAQLHTSLASQLIKQKHYWDFPGGAVVKNPPPNTADAGSIPGQGTRSNMHATTKSSHVTTKEHVCHN